MGWKLLDKPKTHKVTETLARNWSEMDPAPHDRPLSERRLQVYQRLFAEGRFRPVTWASALCTETGGVYRVNGKHTSTLLAGLDKLPDFYVTIEEYECDTLQDVAQLYSTFDSKMMSRTASDIYLSFASTMPELHECRDTTIKLACSAIPYALKGSDVWSRMQAAERAELMLEHPEFVLWLDTTLHNGPTAGERADSVRAKAGHLRRQPVVSAMFLTWQKSHEAATKFWEAVRDETGAKPGDPDRRLARFLLLTGVDTGKGTQRVAKAGAKEMMVKCLHAWNAWRKGETTNLNYHEDKPVPAIK